MTSITLTVTGAKAMASVNGVLTSGMVGIPVTIEYDDIWSGLRKNLVCRCGQWGPDRGQTRTVLDIEESATVAQEVMQADMHLYLGVEGYSADGKLVIPTTWADCGKIRHGAEVGADPSGDPALPVWAQLRTRIRNLEDRLEEKPDQGSGLSQNLCVAIYNLLMDAVYQSSGHEADKAALEELLTGGATGPDVPEVPEDPAITYYTIEKKLTHASINNGAATVQEGASYSAVVTANEGYILKTVVVNMGGTLVPVTDNVIQIPAVTGNLIIVAVAEAEAAGGHEWESGVPYDLTDKVVSGVQLVTGTGRENANDIYVTTDYLNCFDAASICYEDSVATLFFYDVNRNYISDGYGRKVPYLKAVPEGAVYVRLTCPSQYWKNGKVVPVAQTAEMYTPGEQDVVWETGRLDAKTGEEIDASGSRSGYICINGAKCLYSMADGAFAVVCFYDANKTFIAGASSVMQPIDLAVACPGISYIRVFGGTTSRDIILDDSAVYKPVRTLQNVTYSNDNDACSGKPYTDQLIAKSGYTLEGAAVTVTVGGVDITAAAYNSATGEIYIENVTGAIVITATAVEITE